MSYALSADEFGDGVAAAIIQTDIDARRKNLSETRGVRRAGISKPRGHG
jgi:hypothetical protein